MSGEKKIADEPRSARFETAQRGNVSVTRIDGNVAVWVDTNNNGKPDRPDAQMVLSGDSHVTVIRNGKVESIESPQLAHDIRLAEALAFAPAKLNLGSGALNVNNSALMDLGAKATATVNEVLGPSKGGRTT